MVTPDGGGCSTGRQSSSGSRRSRGPRLATSSTIDILISARCGRRSDAVLLEFVEQQYREGRTTRRRSSALLFAREPRRRAESSGAICRKPGRARPQTNEATGLHPAAGKKEGENKMKRITFAMAAVAVVMAAAGMAQAADCDVTIGVVMELTGPAGDYGQAGAKSVEMAFRDINDAGGVATAASWSPIPAIPRARATSPSTSPHSSSRSRRCR